jgi:hypothetical protein
MKGAWFVSPIIRVEEGAAAEGRGVAKKGEIAKRSQEVVENQRLMILALKNEPKSHGVANAPLVRLC